MNEQIMKQEKAKRIQLLHELDILKSQLCESCKKPSSSARSKHETCCAASVRMREIGEELLKLSKNRRYKKEKTKEVKSLSTKKHSIEITEDAVNQMREKGMTYTAIANHFGVSLQTLTNRRQNWELARVRGNRDQMNPQKGNSNTSPKNDVSKPIHSEQTATYTEEISNLKSAIINKDSVIREQKALIDQLTATVNELESYVVELESDQEAMSEERRMLAILLHREAKRMSSLVEKELTH